MCYHVEMGAFKERLSEVTRVRVSIAIELLYSTRKKNPIALYALGGYRRRQPPAVQEGDLFQAFPSQGLPWSASQP